MTGNDSSAHCVFIGIGSNIEPEKNVREAIRLLSGRVKIVRTSSFYRTRALGSRSQPDFINGVVLVRTELDARSLKFEVLRSIERQLGRIRSDDACAPRTIDLDILLFDNDIIREFDLVIPDAHLWERAFLARCVVEIDPEVTPPDRKTPLREAPSLTLDSGLRPLTEFTLEMREYCNE